MRYRLPPDIQAVVRREFGRSALDERADIASLSQSLRAELQSKGLQFVDVDPQAFKSALAKTNFYKSWHAKFGDEAWSILQQSVGTLA